MVFEKSTDAKTTTNQKDKKMAAEEGDVQKSGRGRPKGQGATAGTKKKNALVDTYSVYIYRVLK